MPPQRRETTKVVEVAGRRWQIRKFDALTGSYIAYMLMFQMLPSIMGMIPGVGDQLKGLPQNMPVMDKEAFRKLQMDCLSVCSELKMVGSVEAPIAIILESGAWGVEDLEDDTATVLALTAHAIAFNVSSFFEGDALSGLTDQAKGLVGSLSGVKG